MKKLVVFGSSDLARIAWHYFSHDSEYQIAGFAVDDTHHSATELCGLPVLPMSRALKVFSPGEHEFFVAVGFSRLNRGRAEACGRLRAAGYTLASYVSSRAYLAGGQHGDNCFILANTVIEPFVTLGAGVMLWSGTTIAHDSTVGDYCFFASQVAVSGHVVIGERCFFGVNASVGHGIRIASDCLVGAGAVILKDTREGQVFFSQKTPGVEVSADSLARML